MKFIFPQNYNFKNKLFGIFDYTTILVNILWSAFILIIINFFVEINKYKANIYTDFTILSFHRPTTHSHLKSTNILTPEPTLPKPHHPSPCTTTLASLVKGRWIDGKAQTVALLLSACDMPAPFILQTFLPSRRRDCTPSPPSIRFSALSPSLFILQSSVCLYGFAFALSHSLFVGEQACPARCIVVIDFLCVFNPLSIKGKTQFLFTL